MDESTDRHGRKLTLFTLILLIVVVLDQATKAAVRVVLDNGAITRTLIPGVLELRIVHNTGAAFSLGEGAGPLFIALAAIVVFLFLYMVWKNPDMPNTVVVPLAMVAGGGVGNMIDRLLDGSVLDFLATTFIDFPVFNVADIFVTVGVILAVIGFLMWEKEEQAKEGGSAEKR